MDSLLNFGDEVVLLSVYASGAEDYGKSKRNCIKDK